MKQVYQIWGWVATIYGTSLHINFQPIETCDSLEEAEKAIQDETIRERHYIDSRQPELYIIQAFIQQPTTT